MRYPLKSTTPPRKKRIVSFQTHIKKLKLFTYIILKNSAIYKVRDTT